MNYWRVRKSRGYVVKIDIEKAFDTINWKFIDCILQKKNFPFRWRKWIQACISNVQYSVIVNGQPKGCIKPKRGLKQGDLMSLFIFVFYYGLS